MKNSYLSIIVAFNLVWKWHKTNIYTLSQPIQGFTFMLLGLYIYIRFPSSFNVNKIPLKMIK